MELELYNDVRPKVLIVDDSTDNIQILNNMLQDEYDIIFSTSGVKALKLAETAQPDIILLDIVMPDMDGYEVISDLKENNLTLHIPVIFLTAKTHKEDLIKGFKRGSVDYINKPFFEEEIKARLNVHLENRRLIKELSSINYQLTNVNRQLELQSYTDPLTRIANRRYYNEFIKTHYRQACRENQPMSLMLLDIDFFKLYNDNYGHAQGDSCLLEVARCLDKKVAQRPHDLAARYGGEEFVVVFPNTDIETATRLAKQGLSQIEDLKIAHEKSTVSDYVTASIGVSSLMPPTFYSTEDLIKDADKALYEAKQHGRNQVQTSHHLLQEMVS